jgi:hypothetical protein
VNEITTDEVQARQKAIQGSAPASASRPEILTVGTVLDIERIADDGKPHRVGAVQQVAVHDGLESKFFRDLRRAAAVPAEAVAVFWFHGIRSAE